ncbi:MAG TPA: diacylglycerol kinase family protein [Pyrinomonadaceae bacterium]|nr:diacylglycerol kinase family protein [Pyrinomonadaceae bacterium]
MRARRQDKKSDGDKRGHDGAAGRTARSENAELAGRRPADLTPRPARVSDSGLPLVVVNPTSAGGATGRAWPRLASELRAHFGAFGVAFTERAGHAREIAEREARAGRKFLIACGGDGTVSEMANGILAAGADAELGLLPSGTGGDFRRTLRTPRRDADAAVALRTGRTVKIDAGRVEFSNPEGGRESRFFVNVASCGMGGEVIRRVKQGGSDWLPAALPHALGGRAAFAAAAVRASLAFERPTVAVSLDDGEEHRLAITNFCVANARYFGGGMKIAPTAKLTDGRFDVIAVGDLNTPAILANSYKLYLGTHLGMREVGHARASRVSARAAGAEKILLEVDGELVGRLPADFEILPRVLRVRVPA